MGNQIIKQPDGRYAVFSTETGTVVLRDANEDEVVEWFEEQARRNTHRALAKANTIGPQPDLYNADDVNTPAEAGALFTVTVAANDLADVLDDHQLWLSSQPADEQDWSAHDRLEAVLQEADTLDEARRGFEKIQQFLSRKDPTNGS
jgi:hypothetical protein